MRRFLGVIFIIASMIFSSACSNTENNKQLGYQLDLPLSGEEVAVMETNMGTIKLRFFPEVAPKAVENFKTHSKNGYYNGLTFHRVIDGFMIQGGDPNGNGTGGTSIWGNSFEDEFSSNVLNIRGSVAMANSGKNTNGSQFFINQAKPDAFMGWDYFQKVYDIYKSNTASFESRYGGTVDMSKVTDEIKRFYEENGGNPNLDGALNTAEKGHTVFAQVFEGMDIVDKIAQVEVNQNNLPLNAVIINNISIINYEG